jgi:hypothetical protein
MSFYDTILGSAPSFLKPDDEAELKKMAAEWNGPPEVTPGPAPPPEPTNAWTNPVFLQAMLPLFTELQSVKGELAGYKAKENVAAPPTAPVDLGIAAPGMIAAGVSDASKPAPFGSGARLAVNGPFDGPVALAAAPATQPQYASGIAPADIIFGPQTMPEGNASPEERANAVASSSRAAAPFQIPRPDWSTPTPASIPAPKSNPLIGPASDAAMARRPADAMVPQLFKPASFDADPPPSAVAWEKGRSNQEIEADKKKERARIARLEEDKRNFSQSAFSAGSSGRQGLRTLDERIAAANSRLDGLRIEAMPERKAVTDWMVQKAFDFAKTYAGSKEYHKYVAGFVALRDKAIAADASPERIKYLDKLLENARRPQIDMAPGGPGWHRYSVTSEFDFPLSEEQMKKFLASYGMPGNPGMTAVDGGDGSVADSRITILPINMGDIKLAIPESDDGRTVYNITQPGHSFYRGMVMRHAWQANGKWYVTTLGIGNNEDAIPNALNRVPMAVQRVIALDPTGFDLRERPGPDDLYGPSVIGATMNRWRGPEVFKLLDAEMKKAIQRFLAGHETEPMQ